MPQGKAYMGKRVTDMMGDARRYRLSPPAVRTRWDYRTDTDVTRSYDHVIVSSVDHEFAHETLVFPDNGPGMPRDFADIYNEQGTTSHEDVLADMGYEIIWED